MGGQDKAWVERGGRALVLHLLDALSTSTAPVMVSANRSLQRYAELNVDVVPDRWPDHPGPLAGIASLLRACREECLLTLPVDAARVPADYETRMLNARGTESHCIVVAQDEEGLQPLFALYPVTLAAHVQEWLESGRRSVREWQHRFAVYPCAFPGLRFGNLNTFADLELP
jgi:molybdopterin-guanine dinucleotide biosynthesis protein A